MAGEQRLAFGVDTSAATCGDRNRLSSAFCRSIVSSISAWAAAWATSRSCSRLSASDARTRAPRMTGLKGLGRKSAAPISMQRATLSSSSTPEIMITGKWRSASSDLIAASVS